MTDYDISVQGIDPEYTHTIARQAGRDVDDGRELHLSRVTVTVRLQWRPDRPNADRRSQTVDVTFTVDHDDETVTPLAVGDSYDERESFGVEQVITALDYAERAMVAYMEDVGPNYYLRGSMDILSDVRDVDDDVLVHNDLEVQDV